MSKNGPPGRMLYRKKTNSKHDLYRRNSKEYDIVWFSGHCSLAICFESQLSSCYLIKLRQVSYVISKLHNQRAKKKYLHQTGRNNAYKVKYFM